jgi:hypothetical protein
MSVIDKIVNEWAFRCKKGYPDMNNPNDVKILKEIYSQFGIVMEEDGVQPQIDYNVEIKKLLKTISDQEAKQAIYKYLVKLNKKEDKSDEELEKEIENILVAKKLPKQAAEYVTLLASKYQITQELLEYLHNPTVTLQQLEEQTNLSTLLELSTLPAKFISKLIVAEGRSIGKAEVALVCILKDCTNMGGKKGETEGDVKVGTKPIELKMGKGQLVPHHISGYSSKPTKELYDIFGEDLDFSKGKQWTDQLHTNYNQAEDKDDYIDKVNIMIKEFYSNYVPAITKKVFETKGIGRYVADELAKKYIGEGKNLMLISMSNYNYVFVSNTAEYETLANSNSLTVTYPDKLPRIIYVG